MTAADERPEAVREPEETKPQLTEEELEAEREEYLRLLPHTD
jgi:hypothetical protein